MKRYLVTTAKIVSAALFMLAGFVIVFMVLAWQGGKQANTNPSAFATPAAPKAKKQVRTVDENAVLGVSVQTIESPVTPGSNSSMTIKTNPKATCSVEVRYGSEVAKDSGLAPKQADEFGVTSWAWTVPVSAQIGKWPVKVTCQNKKHSAVVQNDLDVVKTLEQSR